MASDYIEIQRTETIPLKRVADLLCCAFEGGVGYWCEIVSYTKPIKPRSVWGEDTIYPHVDYALTGGATHCRVTDEEDPSELVLDSGAVQKGLKLLAEKHPRHWADFMGENEDVATGDVFLQLCLLGEVVYG